MVKTPIQVRLTDEERSALDDYRRKQQNPPSRAQAAREMIRMALGSRHEDGGAIPKPFATEHAA